MKKFKILSVIILALIICTLSTVTACNDKKKFGNLTSYTKVILCIGDGMGENHIKIGETYFGHDMCFEAFPYKGYVETSSLTPLTATDSAAAATAMATGRKVLNKHVATDYNGNIKSISEYAKEKNLGVAIVTTDSLAGATPAGFSAHTDNRNYTAEIITSQITSNVDLFLGAGYTNYVKYKTQFEDAGYMFCSDYNELTISASKIIGSFSEVLPDSEDTQTPSLVQLADFAYAYMEANYPQGYFMLVEGAHIDKMSHNNDMISMLKYLGEFDTVVGNLDAKLNGKPECALMVTSDHETGDIAPFNGTIDDIDSTLFNVTSHSMQNVRYFFKLYGKQSLKVSETIDNTEIFNIIYGFIM